MKARVAFAWIWLSCVSTPAMALSLDLNAGLLSSGVRISQNESSKTPQAWWRDSFFTYSIGLRTKERYVGDSGLGYGLYAAYSAEAVHVGQDNISCSGCESTSVTYSYASLTPFLSYRLGAKFLNSAEGRSAHTFYLGLGISYAKINGDAIPYVAAGTGTSRFTFDYEGYAHSSYLAYEYSKSNWYFRTEADDSFYTAADQQGAEHYFSIARLKFLLGWFFHF